MAASKQANIHTHVRKCSHASVGLAQARPNYLYAEIEPLRRGPCDESTYCACNSADLGYVNV